MKTMGKRIRQKRQEKEMTMEELGRLLGVNKTTISKWENGEVGNIKRSYIAEMAKIFDVTPVWLMGYEDAQDVTLTYSAPNSEVIECKVDGDPILKDRKAYLSHMSRRIKENHEKRDKLYRAAMAVRPSDYDIAIEFLESLNKREE